MSVLCLLGAGKQHRSTPIRCRALLYRKKESSEQRIDLCETARMARPGSTNENGGIYMSCSFGTRTVALAFAGFCMTHSVAQAAVADFDTLSEGFYGVDLVD